ncbi:T9SS type A sorting domain-containing protein [Paraflavisolibacter sp. H34]|uniref:T9SS type A sorting domain-containing protein n=1 Tax=Huijunlia imazamoxiresistens TaxID=3127457 RepID=UPI003019B019
MKSCTLFALCTTVFLALRPSAHAAPEAAPTVISINRQAPATSITSATAVTFRVTFSEKVSGVDASDFTATPLSGNVRGSLALLANEPVGTEAVEAVVRVNGSTYDVTVRALAGNGLLRLDLNASGTGIKDDSGNAISSGYTSGQTYSIQPSGLGFASFNDIAPLPISSHTADKPQAKVWTYDGKWWSVLPTSDGTKIFRLDGTSWTDVLTLVSSSNCKADVQAVGNVVHILLFRGGGNSSYLVSAEYDATAGTYRLWRQRSSRVTLKFETSCETATMALDGAGRMWVAWDRADTINVRWSDAPYSTWSATIPVASDIRDDDICAIAALPGKIGVLWSNQSSKRFGFRTHADGADPSVWSADEVPSSQSALDEGYGMADDHLNMKVASDGTLYCGVKTGYDTPGLPKLSLLVRRPSGTWDNLYPVTANEGTRPFVLLNEAAGKLKVVYASEEGGGDILYRETALSTISFGPPITLMSGHYDFNYVTSTHQSYGSDIVVIATDQVTSPRQAVSVRGTDDAAPVSAAPLYAPEVAAEVFKAAPAVAGSLQAAPAAFSASTRVTFALPEEGAYSVVLYDGRGVKLSVLRRGRAAAGLPQQLTLDGSALSAGIYFLRLETAGGVRTVKVVKR